MKIKYEPVFGDQSLFYNAQSDCEMVGNGHHKVEHGKIMVWNFSEKYWAESHTSKIAIEAMRRVIKTPTWTRANQEAGVLPPVGCKYLAGYDNRELECLYNDATGNVWGFDSRGAVFGYTLGYCRPIETPEEKAQREQDEFLESLHYSKSKHPASFYEGALAAYTKLKVPTND